MPHVHPPPRSWIREPLRPQRDPSRLIDRKLTQSRTPKGTRRPAGPTQPPRILDPSPTPGKNTCSCPAVPTAYHPFDAPLQNPLPRRHPLRRHHPHLPTLEVRPRQGRPPLQRRSRGHGRNRRRLDDRSARHLTRRSAPLRLRRRHRPARRHRYPRPPRRRRRAPLPRRLPLRRRRHPRETVPRRPPPR